MSVKAVKEYYDQVCNQYAEMLENLRDLEQSLADGMIEPERITRLEEQIRPLRDNYERWSYMMFLLNQPERKQKHAGYAKRNKKLISSLSYSNSIDATLNENKNVIENIRSF